MQYAIMLHMPTEFSKVHYQRFYERDEETYNKLVALAEKNHRSVNAEVLVALKEYIKKHEKELEENK